MRPGEIVAVQVTGALARWSCRRSRSGPLPDGRPRKPGLFEAAVRLARRRRRCCRLTKRQARGGAPPGRRKPSPVRRKRPVRRKPCRQAQRRPSRAGCSGSPRPQTLVGSAHRRHRLALHQEEARQRHAGRARGHADPGRFRPRHDASVTETLRRDRFDRDISADEVRAVLASRGRKGPRPGGASRWSIDPAKKPFVILMIGVNGSGKTTTIGKLAAQLRRRGQVGDAGGRRHLPRRRDRAAAGLGPAHRRRRSSPALRAPTPRALPSTR